MGSRPSGISSRPKGSRRARSIWQSVEYSRAKYPLVSRRFGGSWTVEQDHIEVRRRGKHPSEKPRRKEPAFRNPRTLNGCNCEWTLALKTSTLRRDVFHF